MKSKYVQRILKSAEPLTMTYCKHTYNFCICYEDLDINIKIFPLIIAANTSFVVHAATEESKLLRKLVCELVREKDLS